MKNKYFKENFEPIVLNSKNYAEVLRKLDLCVKGNSRTTLKKYVEKYNIDISHFDTQSERNKIKGRFRRIPLTKILIKDSQYTSTNHLKNRLYDEGLKNRICELCGQNELWNGGKMSLILDHINGINDDNQIKNLRIICPNCDATLPTFCRGTKHMSKN